jgi:tetratricopeptide (TPR) repeat protein
LRCRFGLRQRFSFYPYNLLKLAAMGTRALWISVIAVILSFCGGFLLANALNRNELTALRGENDRLKNEATGPKTGNNEPSPDEEEMVRSKIASADANPGNFDFQKKVGMAIYLYAAAKNDTSLLAESSRILTRANQLNSKDHDVALSLAHSYFDTGYYGKDDKSFEKAREAYAKALALKPGDADTQTEIGMTWLLVEPPDYARAVTEFQKSLQFDPKNEKTLRFLTEAYARSGNAAEAQKSLARLREANPASPSLSELATLISQGSQSK